MMIVSNNIEKIVTIINNATSATELSKAIEYSEKCGLFSQEDMAIIKYIVNEKIIEIDSRNIS